MEQILNEVFAYFMVELNLNLNCDFCNVEIENDGEGSAFSNGTAFCHLDFSDDIACESCYEKGLWHEKHKEVAKDEFGSWLFGL